MPGSQQKCPSDAGIGTGPWAARGTPRLLQRRVSPLWGAKYSSFQARNCGAAEYSPRQLTRQSHIQLTGVRQALLSFSRSLWRCKKPSCLNRNLKLQQLQRLPLRLYRWRGWQREVCGSKDWWSVSVFASYSGATWGMLWLAMVKPPNEH